VKNPETLIGILARMGDLDPADEARLSLRCHDCAEPAGQTCGECPADEMGVELAMAQGLVSPGQVHRARELQGDLHAKSNRRRWRAVQVISVAARRSRRSASGRLLSVAAEIAAK